MSKKLYFVEVTKTGWVLAEDETEAERFKYDILSTEDIIDVEVSPYTNEEHLKSTGWDDGCLLYHENAINGVNISVHEALETYKKEQFNYQCYIEDYK